MKYNVTLMKTTVFTRYATVTVEADCPKHARDLARDLDDYGHVEYPEEPDDWGTEYTIDNVEAAQ